MNILLLILFYKCTHFCKERETSISSVTIQIMQRCGYFKGGEGGGGNGGEKKKREREAIACSK